MKKIIIAILLSLFLFACYTPKEIYEQHATYKVIVSNGAVFASYFCDKYELNLLTKTYKLFKKDGSFVAEITITDGFIIRIEPNDYVRWLLSAQFETNTIPFNQG